jgi:hypothetical protein
MKKEKVWSVVKKEVILLAIVILSWAIFGLINNYLG